MAFNTKIVAKATDISLSLAFNTGPTAAIALPPTNCSTRTDKISRITIYLQKFMPYKHTYNHCTDYRNDREFHSFLTGSQRSLKIHTEPQSHYRILQQNI